MKKMFLKHVKNKNGMTLVETLTALSIVALMIFCFTPLFLSHINSINISGENLKRVYHSSGILQGLIGMANTGTTGNHDSSYVASVGTMPLELTVNGSGGTETLKTGGSEIPNMKGDLFLSDPESMNTSFATVKPHNLNTYMKCFPETITDDFDVSYITIYAEGFTFQANVNDATAYQLFCTEEDESKTNGFKRTKLVAGKDYSLQKVEGTANMLLLTLYGGTKVSFENSPIVFIYNESESISIEVDAPTMIMVGEKAKDDKYYYYVSRGDVDESGNLKFFRRKMNVKGLPEGEGLNSAMNDVEWVPEDRGDGHNSITGAKGNTFKYGYYVMCGDNGQVRRFWRNPKTGNYYWGGDYTARTDISFDRVANNKHITIQRPLKPMLDTSYKFFSRRGDSNGNLIYGYKLGGFKDANAIVSYNTWSVTALADHANNAKIYVPVGKMFSYSYVGEKGPIGKYSDVIDVMNNPNDEIMFPGDTTKTKIGYKWRIQNNHESFNWVVPEADSFSTAVQAEDNPITLTCVDSIFLTKDNPDADTLAGFHGNYKNNGHIKNDNFYFTQGENIPVGNTEYYPQSSYTLYCGYIPGFMDVWSEKSWTDVNFQKQFPSKTVPYPDTGIQSCIVWTNGNKANCVSDIQKQNTQFNIPNSGNIAWSEAYPNWKANLGVVPYVTDNKDGNLDIGNGVTAYNRDADNRHVTFFPYKNLKYAYTGKFYDGQIPPSELSYWCSNLEKNGASTNPSLLAGKLYNILGFRKQNEQFVAKAWYDHNPFGGSYGWNSSVDINNPNGYPIGGFMAPPRQSHMTMGKPVDITIAYLSEPFAIEAGANPTNQYGAKVLGDIENQYVMNMTNDLVDNTLYWHNRRETVTMLDCATTLVPIVDESDPNNPKYGDISVSIMGGYTVGGIVQYYGQSLPEQNTLKAPFSSNSTNIPFVNTIMNNGIIYLRAGDSYRNRQYAKNSYTGEYFARDATGYLLASECNTFHQFYYLNSYQYDSTYPADGNHFGNVKGAKYWADNRHINILSLDGKEPKSGDYNYLRCHPMSNTKVNAVAWGTAWDGSPEAMWATENGTVLSWYVNIKEAAKSYGGYNNIQGHKVDQDKAANWNDRSVKAELQSYQWIDNCDNKTFPTGSKQFIDSTGSAHWGSKNPTGQPFKPGDGNFEQFYDRGSRELGNRKFTEIGVVNVLNSINDVAYDNDVWVAGGDQSGKNPATYCPNKSVTYGVGETEKVCSAYTGSGTGGSWIYVRYWVDVKGTGFPSADNAHYLWKAVKISDNEFYNIVQVNNINGTWIATGYVDANKNGENDEDEKTVVCWATDPLAACDSGTPGAWTDKSKFFEYDEGSKNKLKDVTDTVGAINSCATR